jgi:hypothetical protein
MPVLRLSHDPARGLSSPLGKWATFGLHLGVCFQASGPGLFQSTFRPSIILARSQLSDKPLAAFPRRLGPRGRCFSRSYRGSPRPRHGSPSRARRSLYNGPPATTERRRRFPLRAWGPFFFNAGATEKGLLKDLTATATELNAPAVALTAFLGISSNGNGYDHGPPPLYYPWGRGRGAKRQGMLTACLSGLGLWPVNLALPFRQIGVDSFSPTEN